MPLLNFRSDTILNAFILNAVSISFISILAVSLESYLESIIDKKGKPIYNKAISHMITFAATFIGAFIIYMSMWFLFGFGSAMVSKKVKSFFH